MAVLYTIGHSTRSLHELLDVLASHSIETLVDIRAFPFSRRLPHFNRENLERALVGRRIRYLWMKALGGYRKRTLAASPHLALHNQSFRNYADYMLSEDFHKAAERLVSLGQKSRTVYMCAERVHFRCHRMLVSDYLTAHGHQVWHIDSTGPAQAHQLMAEARIVEGQLIYRGDNLL